MFIGYQDTGGIQEIWTSLPAQHKQINTNSIPLFISFIFYGLVPYTSIPYVQRALIAKNKKQFLQTFIEVGILTIPILVIICLMGLITYHNNPNLESGQVLYYFIDNYLPSGVKGLMIAGLLAIIMST